MWALHEAANRCERLLELCGAKVLDAAARLCSGDTKVRQGGVKVHCVVSAHNALVILRMTCVILGLAWHQYTSPTTDFVLATHLDLTVGACLGVCERGHWRQGVQIAASLLSGDSRKYDTILAKMPVKDRTK
jgi:hypothetical protein